MLLFHYIAIVVEDRNLLVVLAFITGVCVGVLVRRRPRETPPRDGPIRDESSGNQSRWHSVRRRLDYTGRGHQGKLSHFSIKSTAQSMYQQIRENEYCI